MRKRIYFHGTDRESLFKLIDRNALPTQYGGDLKIPSEPIGEAVWEYFYHFQKEFEGNNM